MVTFRVNEQKERNVMVDVHTIASYINQRYEYQYGSRIDEMKLQILLYFMQREGIVQTGSPLFEATFYAHPFGPYLPEVHAAYISNSLHDVLPSSVLEEYKPIFDSVFDNFNIFKKWFIRSNNSKFRSFMGISKDKFWSNKIKVSNIDLIFKI